DVPVGQVIAYVLGSGEQLPEPDAKNPPAAAAVAEAKVVQQKTNGSAPAEPARRTLASPKARRLARERGLRIEELAGSGPYGAVTAADVESHRPAPAAAPAPAAGVSGAWQTMARRMAESWQTVPHFYLSRDVDASRLKGWRDALRKRPGLEKVTHTDLLVKICAAA